MSDKLAEFKKELKDLLEKHNAGISFMCSDSSDLYGVYGAGIGIYIINDSDTEVMVSEGYSVDSYDLKGA